MTHQNRTFQKFKVKYYSCNHLRLGRRLCHGRDHGAHLEWLPSSLGLVDKLHVVQASTDVSGEKIDNFNSQVTDMREISELPVYLQQVEEKCGDDEKNGGKKMDILSLPFSHYLPPF